MSATAHGQLLRFFFSHGAPMSYKLPQLMDECFVALLIVSKSYVTQHVKACVVSNRSQACLRVTVDSTWALAPQLKCRATSIAEHGSLLRNSYDRVRALQHTAFASLCSFESITDLRLCDGGLCPGPCTPVERHDPVSCSSWPTASLLI